jgi:hypothetical protein
MKPFPLSVGKGQDNSIGGVSRRVVGPLESRNYEVCEVVPVPF